MARKNDLISLYCCRCNEFCGTVNSEVLTVMKELRRVGYSDDTICGDCAYGKDPDRCHDRKEFD